MTSFFLVDVIPVSKDNTLLTKKQYHFRLGDSYETAISEIVQTVHE